MFLVGDPYKPSFATVTGRGDNPRYSSLTIFSNVHSSQTLSQIIPYQVELTSPLMGGTHQSDKTQSPLPLGNWGS